jgi:glycosyltransferase involved in cell wall biosynthesis
MPQLVQIFSNAGGDDSAYFQGWCKAMRADGFTVEIVSCLTTAEYRSAKTRWQRIVLRWRMYVAYAFTIIAACRRNPDAVRIVTTNPFYAPLLAALVSRHPGRVIMLLFDLFPDALQVSAQGRSSLFHRLLASVTRASFRRCGTVVFLGDRLRHHAEARHGRARRGVVIPVGADTSVFENDVQLDEHRVGPLQVLYCGQMGYMHDISTLSTWLQTDLPPDMQLRFHASGHGYAALKAACAGKARDERIDWQGSLAGKDWRKAMLQAHIGLVTLAPGAARVSMPSKTYSAMSAGQAILAIAPEDSDLAALIRETGCGWIIKPGDAAALNQALQEALKDKAGLLLKRQHAVKAARSVYDTRVIGVAWSRLIKEIVG